MRKLLLIAVLLLCVQCALAAPAFVQKKAASCTSQPCVVTLDGAPTDGNTLIACVSNTVAAANGVSSITGGGVTWSSGVTLTNSTVNIEIWYGHEASSGGAAVTINSVSGSGRMRAVVSEFSGLASAAPEDTDTSSGTDTTPTTAAASNTTAAAVFIGATANSVSTATTAASQTNSFLDLDSGVALSSSGGESAAYKIVSSTSSESVGWTIGSSQDWVTVIAEFKGAATGPTNAQRSAGFFMQQ